MVVVPVSVFFSGTPFDKEEHAVNLLKLIGYIRSHRLYTYVRETKEIVLEGMPAAFINPDEIPLFAVL